MCQARRLRRLPMNAASSGAAGGGSGRYHVTAGRTGRRGGASGPGDTMGQFEDVRRLLAVGVLACAIGAALGAAGCEAFDDDDDDDDRGGEVVSGGSGGARPSAVPASAQVVDTGDADLSFTASTAGTAYVVDAAQGRLILSRPMSSGQRLVVQPEEDRVQLDGQAIFQQNLERNNRHTIWWQPGGTAGNGTIGTQVVLPAELQNAQRVASGMG